jgi:hypothetical protein
MHLQSKKFSRGLVPGPRAGGVNPLPHPPLAHPRLPGLPAENPHCKIMATPLLRARVS